MLLFHAKAPEYMWVDALSTAVRLLNHRAVVNKSITPFELFWKRKPTVHYFRVWGCLAYVKLPDKDLTALGPRSLSGMFIGYEPNCKAYCVRVSGKVVVSKNVRFFEHKLGIEVLNVPYHHVLSESLVSEQPEILDDGSNNEEEEWDFSPAPVQQILQQARNQAIGIPAAFPDAMIQRLQQVIRQPLAVESNGPSSAGPDEAANDSHVPTTSNDSQAPPTSTNDDDDDLPNLGEGIPDSDDEDDDPPPRGSGRYNLRSQVKEPQRYIPQSFMSFP